MKDNIKHIIVGLQFAMLMAAVYTTEKATLIMLALLAFFMSLHYMYDNEE